MNKNFTCTLLILLLLGISVLLTSCDDSKEMNKKPQPINEEKSKPTIGNINDAVSTIKRETPTDYTLIEYKPYYFTGQKTPEVYALYRPLNVTETDYSINIIRVYQYIKERDSWEQIYNKSVEDKMQVVGSNPIKLTKNSQEQMVISVQEGSGAFFNYLLIGSKNNKTATSLLDSFHNEKTPGYYQGSYELFDDKHLVFYESDRVAAVYRWNDSKLIGVDPSSIPELSSFTTFAEESESNVLLTYKINENGKIESNYSKHETIFSKVGQKISLKRIDANKSRKFSRIQFFSQNNPNSIDSKTGEILAPDIITISIIPNGSDRENEFVFYINALDENPVSTSKN